MNIMFWSWDAKVFVFSWYKEIMVSSCVEGDIYED